MGSEKDCFFQILEGFVASLSKAWEMEREGLR